MRSSEKEKQPETFEIKMELLDINIKNEGQQPKGTLELSDCFMICQKEALNKFLCAVACSKCFVAGQVSLKVVEGSSLRLSVQAILVCQSCKETLMEDYLCQLVDGSRQSETPFEVNL